MRRTRETPRSPFEALCAPPRVGRPAAAATCLARAQARSGMMRRGGRGDCSAGSASHRSPRPSPHPVSSSTPASPYLVHPPRPPCLSSSPPSLVFVPPSFVVPPLPLRPPPSASPPC
eukprot:4777524-Pyramimonas_sp.AAC.1